MTSFLNPSMGLFFCEVRRAEGLGPNRRCCHRVGVDHARGAGIFRLSAHGKPALLVTAHGPSDCIGELRKLPANA